MKDETYNGWRNYETWCCANHGLIEYWAENFEDDIRNCTSQEDLDRISDGIYDWIQEDFDTMINNEIGSCSSLVRDLIRSDKIDWYEVTDAVRERLEDVVHEKLASVEEEEEEAAAMPG